MISFGLNLCTYLSTASHQPGPLLVFPSSLFIRALTFKYHIFSRKAKKTPFFNVNIDPSPIKEWFISTSFWISLKSNLLPGVHCHHHVQATMERGHVHCELLVSLQTSFNSHGLYSRQEKFWDSLPLYRQDTTFRQCAEWTNLVFELLPTAAPRTRIHHVLPQRVLHLLEQ